ncbi:Protein GLUTAMINE DUMPER 3 [Linum grandiflorum]
MLGLIAFALLILACSYWKLSGYLDGAERDLESGEGGDEEEYEEKVLVIMAGQLNPTFLATPASSRSSSFEKTCSCNDKSVEVEKQGENRGSEEQSENRGNSSTRNESAPAPTTTTGVDGFLVEVNTTTSH